MAPCTTAEVIRGRGNITLVCELAPHVHCVVPGGGPTAINKFIGSIAFIAAARSAYVVTMDPESEDEDRLSSCR